MAVYEKEIVPGRVYVTKNYLFVQVLDIASQDVIYRVRRPSLLRHLLPSPKRLSVEAFAASIKAEINGEYFPDFTDLKNYAFRRPINQDIALRRYLCERAAYRPFVTMGRGCSRS